MMLLWPFMFLGYFVIWFVLWQLPGNLSIIIG